MPLTRKTRKILSLPALVRAVRRAHAHRKTVVFTNGCYDLLHAGHVALLTRARRLGDLLIVAINSDRSVRLLKGAGRPVATQRDRAQVLAALESVDYVTVFGDLTPARLIRRIRPDVLVKGADWTRGEIVGSDVVRRVVRLPLLKGRSTSALLARIRRGIGVSRPSGARPPALPSATRRGRVPGLGRR